MSNNTAATVSVPTTAIEQIVKNEIAGYVTRKVDIFVDNANDDLDRDDTLYVEVRYSTLSIDYNTPATSDYSSDNVVSGTVEVIARGGGYIPGLINGITGKECVANLTTGVCTLQFRLSVNGSWEFYPSGFRAEKVA